MNWIFADYVRAKVLFERGLYLREKYQPKNLLSIAESYDYLGMCYVEQGELENARQCFNKVNNISTSFAKEDATSIFSSLYVNIGAIYSAQNDYKKALEYYLKALDLLEKIENEDKGALLICNANIAESYCQLGNINKADYYANKAKVIYEDNPIKIYPFSSELSILLGLICSSKNELVNALSYFESALEERKQQLGPNHPYTALAHYQIGRVYKKQGDFVKAKEYLDNAKKIQEKCFNPNHYALTKTLNEFEGLTS